MPLPILICDSPGVRGCRSFSCIFLFYNFLFNFKLTQSPKTLRIFIIQFMELCRYFGDGVRLQPSPRGPPRRRQWRTHARRGTMSPAIPGIHPSPSCRESITALRGLLPHASCLLRKGLQRREDEVVRRAAVANGALVRSPSTPFHLPTDLLCWLFCALVRSMTKKPRCRTLRFALPRRFDRRRLRAARLGAAARCVLTTVPRFHLGRQHSR
jgi:hypothetical protein